MSQLTQHTKSLVDTEWIPALSPTRWNVQTMTKSFVDKRRPWQNGVPDRHVGDKLIFQVNWTLWINSIALSSSDHPSSIQNIGWYGVDSRSFPNVMCFRGCISTSAVKSSVVSEVTHPITSRLPPGVLLNGVFYNTMNGVDSLLSPQLEETSKPRQNHLLIKECLGRTEYLINTWATNWVFKSIERFESTA